MSKKLLVMAGGTGGHVFPAIAGAQTLQKEGWEICWLGTKEDVYKRQVKEMTASILQQTAGNPEAVLFTNGNFNNDIGVPLTLLRLTEQHKFAVIELGANHQGEIDYTTHLAQPEAALVNNVAAAHLEGFGSIEGVALEMCIRDRY